MTYLLFFLAGLFVGGACGFLLCALLTMSRLQDLQLEIEAMQRHGGMTDGND